MFKDFEWLDFIILLKKQPSLAHQIRYVELLFKEWKNSGKGNVHSLHHVRQGQVFATLKNKKSD